MVESCRSLRDHPATGSPFSWAVLVLVASLMPSSVLAQDPLAAPESKRLFLTLETLTSKRGKPSRLLHYDHFMPIGEVQPATEPFEGELEIPAFKVALTGARTDRFRSATFPAIKAGFFARDGRLIPVQQDRMHITDNGYWDIILSTGRTWQEKGDDGWSRAAFPFTLVDQKWNGSRNGVATFLYKGREVSRMQVQVAQESAPDFQFDLTGIGEISFRPRALPEKEQVWQELKRQEKAATPVRPWRELEDQVGKDLLAEYDAPGARRNITTSALLVEGTLYRKPCRTRFGPYPFCDEMRHSVYSVTKTLGALIALLRLAKLHGPEVMEEKVVDYIDIPARHDGWDAVTFRDTINMTTGIGDVIPQKVSRYVDTDVTPLSLRTGAAPTTREKIALIAGFDDYPWEPGEVFRYRTVDSFVLSLAMDRLIKKHRGSEYGLWQMMAEDVFHPLGIGVLPVARTREPKAKNRIPHLGLGLTTTMAETLRLAELLHAGGRWQGKQILNKDLTEEAISDRREIGMPTGWHYQEGGEAHYHMSFWRMPYRAKAGCRRYIPGMSGYGGNYVLLLPNNMIALRMADGGYNARGTWDSFGMRKVADAIKSFC